MGTRNGRIIFRDISQFQKLSQLFSSSYSLSLISIVFIFIFSLSHLYSLILHCCLQAFTSKAYFKILNYSQSILPSNLRSLKYFVLFTSIQHCIVQKEGRVHLEIFMFDGWMGSIRDFLSTIVLL